MQTKRFKLSIIGCISVAIISLVVANVTSESPDKEIKQAQSAFLKKFPKTESNASAIKLQELTAKLGFIAFGGSQSSQKITVADADKKAFEEIREELDYIDTHLQNPNDKLELPPEKIRHYLDSHADSLAAIRKYVLTHETPQWEMDITPMIEGKYYQLPSFWALANVQKILALDILYQNYQGNTQAMLETLEVSWKLNESLQNRPELTSQLDSIMIIRNQVGVIRKIDNLPPEWQQRLLKHDYRQSMLTTVELVSLSLVTVLTQKNLYNYYQERGGENPYEWLRYSSPLFQPYIRGFARNTYQKQQKNYAQLPQENVCTSNVNTLLPKSSWWNPSGEFVGEQEWIKGGQLMLDLELTQKIIQAKEAAAKEGKWPNSLPNLDSSICPNTKWIYQVSPDGTMSISLHPIPTWATKYKSGEIKSSWNKLPLNYSGKVKQ